MSGGLFDTDILDDDDYLDGDDDEAIETQADYHEISDAPSEVVQENQEKPKAVIKKMPPGLLRRLPDVVTMLITKSNGRQVLFVNPNLTRSKK